MTPEPDEEHQEFFVGNTVKVLATEIKGKVKSVNFEDEEDTIPIYEVALTTGETRHYKEEELEAAKADNPGEGEKDEGEEKEEGEETA